jgi:hydrogenase nickel incorporation protein HypA/HybF
MHEVRVAGEIIRVVEHAMAENGLTTVKELGLRIGRLSTIDAETLAFAFTAATSGTPLAVARLRIEAVPAKAHCRQCETGFSVDEMVFTCPHCGAPDTDLVAGEEIEIAYITGE